MIRRLFSILAILSLLLLVVTAVLCVRSYYIADQLGRHHNGYGVALNSAHGVLSCWITNSTPDLDGDHPWKWRKRRLESSGHYGPMGFVTVHAKCTIGDVPVQENGRVWWLQHWIIALATVPLPLWWAARFPARKRKQRRRLGLCLHCGYDLRASTERCPECGTPVHEGHVAKVTA